MANFLSSILSEISPQVSGSTNESDIPAPMGNHSAYQNASNEEIPVEYLVSIIRDSGLFEYDFYNDVYADVKESGVDPLEHFFNYGYKEGRRPNPYFEPLWYLEQNPDVQESQVHPLVHYILHGDREGRRPAPLFDPSWYRTAHALPPELGALAHYLANRLSCTVSPIPEFDAEYYASNNPDVKAAGVDPFEHFLNNGYREGRNPSPDFDVRFYAFRYLNGDMSQNPFLHYLQNKHQAGVFGRLPEHETTIAREIKKFTKPSLDFENFQPLPRNALKQVKALAYYLPQFHAFPENDAWWGTGFTEWTNLVRGVPRFEGHYQPRVPRDLGFYCLDNNEPLRRQVEMALTGGIYGFVFYYYWFNGKRIMDKPIWRFLEDKSIDMPFCLMWANENWTRRWDGAESEVLISQDYRSADDEAMAAEFAMHFEDPRYIRINNRPMLMIYRPGIIPDAAQTIERWRDIFRSRFNEDPILIMAQSFLDADPDLFGLDGAIEFPPHKLTKDLGPINDRLRYLDDDFTGKVVSYDDVVEVSLKEPAPSYPLIKTAVPSWDNDARRQGSGLTITGSTPKKFEAWVTALVDRAKQNPFFGEPIICINAWNEWCEGAYLEPDLHFGAAYLNATGRAVTGLSKRPEGSRLLLVGHDAFPSGAQQLLLKIGETLRYSFGVDIEFLLLGGGKLEQEYRQTAPTTVATSEFGLDSKLKALAERGFANAIVNTTAAAGVIDQLRTVAIEPILLVHELPRIIKEKHLFANAKSAITQARQTIFPSSFVRDQVLKALEVEPNDRILVMPQGIYKEVGYDPARGHAFREELGIAADDYLVLGAGYGDLRKGLDLFLQLWRQLQSLDIEGRVHCVWVGGIDPTLQDWLSQEIADAKDACTFHMPGYRNDMEAVFSATDVFALTSREDPFPSVALEGLKVGVPVVAFARSGGIPDLIQEIGEGHVVPYCDVGAMAATIIQSLKEGISLERRTARYNLMTERFSWKPYVGRLLKLSMPHLSAVSVAVPNYNYAHFMPQRLGSIFHQNYPIHEIIVLDDCSRDNSAAVISAVASEAAREIHFVPNLTNSGSVFAQWRKATELASGEFLWIAEADDLSDPDFIASAVRLLGEDPSIEFVFTDSRAINADGTALWPSYKAYYGSVEPGGLSRSEVFTAFEFVSRFLSVKNVILNASAVVWRTEALRRALQDCGDELKNFRMAGDWRLYLQVLSKPGAKIAFEAQPLNVHRRHSESVTHALEADKHVAEIKKCHRVARSLFGISASVRSQQQVYLNEVAAQLGITKNRRKTITKRTLPNTGEN